MPRPAMLVEMVTEPLRPLCATISASLCTFSGFAFSSSYLMPACARQVAQYAQGVLFFSAAIAQQGVQAVSVQFGGVLISVYQATWHMLHRYVEMLCDGVPA